LSYDGVPTFSGILSSAFSIPRGSALGYAMQSRATNNGANGGGYIQPPASKFGIVDEETAAMMDT